MRGEAAARALPAAASAARGRGDLLEQVFE
jgi:hypothetical protein